MTITSDLLGGIAQRLEDAGIGSYRPDGSSYPSGETAILFSRVPQSPDRCIVLSDYVVGDNAALARSLHRVQFRFRGVPNDVSDVWSLRDSVYAIFQSDSAHVYGAVGVSQSLRLSSIPNGQDANDRYEIADNYSFDVCLPATANRPS